MLHRTISERFGCLWLKVDFSPAKSLTMENRNQEALLRQAALLRLIPTRLLS
jgi:hypothetical protein